MRLSWKKKWQRQLGVILLYSFVTAGMTYPLILRVNQLPVDVADPQNYLNRDSFIFLWNFWWLKHSLFHLGAQPFYSNYIFYPHGTSLVFLPFIGVYSIASLPFQWLFSGETGVIVAYSIVVLCSFVLAAYFGYLLSMEVVGDSRASFVAGLLYSFCANRVWNLSALNLFCYEFVALFIFFVVRLLKAPSLGRGVAVGLSFALLFYSSLNYALFSLGLSLVLIAWYTVANRLERDYLKGVLANGATAVTVFVLAASPFLAAIWSFVSDGHLSAAKMQLEAPTAFSNDLLSFVIPSFYQKFYDALIDFRFLYSKGFDWRVIGLKSFLGYTALLLAVVGLIRCADRKKWIWFGSFGLFLVLSMGPYLHVGGRVLRNVPLPYLALYKWLTVLQIARAPERMIVIVMLSLAVLAAYGVKALGEWKPGGKTAIVALAAAFILLENIGAPLRTARFPVPDIYYEMARDAAEYAILDIPMSEGMRPISMYFQIVHQKPTVSGQVPRRSPGSMSLVESDPLLHSIIKDELAQYYFDLLDSPDKMDKISSTQRKLRENNIKYVFLHTWHLSRQDEAIAKKLVGLLKPVRLVYRTPYLKGEVLVYQMH